MTFYREQFPQATVIPKMHMLEKHVVDWLDQWQVGIGLMGEQGAEAIHAYFNNLKVTYRNIPNGVERLRCMMKQHYVYIAPSTIACRPPPVKRQKLKRRTITDFIYLIPLQHDCVQTRKYMLKSVALK